MPYLKAHELIMHLYDRETVDVKRLQQHTILYVEADEATKKLILNKMVLESAPALFGQASLAPKVEAIKEKPVEKSIEDLLDTWFAEKKVYYPEHDNFTERARKRWSKGISTLKRWRDMFAMFFAETQIKYASELKGGLDYKYIEWRSEKKFDGRSKFTPTADATLKRELDVFHQIADIAEREGCIARADIFKAKAKRGIKKKVDGYDREEQKKILNELAFNDLYHDTALFLLVSGLRIGELGDLVKQKLWDGKSKMHIPGTKTENAERNIPVSPTLRKIWERGYIFNLNVHTFQDKMKKLKEKLGLKESATAHRFRHSFVRNKLKAGVSFQYVREWVGHGDPGFTIKRYGEFLPNDSNDSYEEDLAEATAHLDWLEKDYFESFE